MVVSGVDGLEVWTMGGFPENLSLEGRFELGKRRGWADCLWPLHGALMGWGPLLTSCILHSGDPGIHLMAGKILGPSAFLPIQRGASSSGPHPTGCTELLGDSNE